MSKKIDVTVIMPYFKKIKYFKKTYLSLTKQTYKNYRVLIIYDDKNLHELIKIKKIVKNEKFKILINKKNLGAGLSRNKAKKLIKTKYVAFLDCDDLWKKNKLKTQLNFMKKNNLKFSHTAYDIIDENNNLIRKISIKTQENYDDLLKSCDIGLSTVILKNNLFQKYSFAKTKTKEDYILWLKMAKDKIKITGLNLSLSSWRKSKNSLSSNSFQKILDAFNVYHIYEKKNLVMSIIYTIRLSLNFLIKNYSNIKYRI